VAAVAGFLMLAAAGVLMLLFFSGRLLMAGRLGTVSLPVMAAAGAVASAFNPCALPALPAFLARGGGARGDPGPAAALGAMTVVLAFGLVVTVLGMEAQTLVAPGLGWLQVAAGAVLITMALLHLTGRMGRLPLVGALVTAGSRLWELTLQRPTRLGDYLFGAGFVAVGGT
jgi:cytochrome c biogenesis protein CcdA